MVARMHDQTGRLLGGRYRLVAPIGTGASAQVFLADDTTLERKVAVKVLHPALASDEAFLRRFRAEARAAAALSHPNVMAVYDWGEDDGPYLVLEYLGGGSLRAMLDNGGRLTPSQALVVGLEAARALDAAHRRGFVHRDIKPANLLFGDDGRLRIADFGLARALSEAGWTEPGGGLVGTARYAAPEQAQASRVDGKADVYALGLVLIEAVTGSVPLTSSEGALQTMTARVATPVPVPDAMDALRPILERMGRPNPEERPEAGEVGRALVAAARLMGRPGPLPLPGAAAVQSTADVTVFPEDDITVLAREADATQTIPAVRRRRRRWPWALAAAALLGGAGGFAYTRISGPTAVVPVVTSLSVADARARITAADAAASNVTWRVREKHVFADGTTAGTVIKQQPAGNRRAADGSSIVLTVSDGPTPVRLPADLLRATVDAAAASLQRAQLQVGAVIHARDENVPPGQIITWRYGAVEQPTQAPKGASIDLVVSDGPAARPIPSLAGATPEQAQAELAKLGLQPTTKQEFSDTVETGKVTRTDPPAGGTAEKGATVTIYVSKGPDLVTVPDVSRYNSLDDASAALEAAGLQLGSVTGRGTRPAASDPPAGSKVKRGSSVDVFLRK